MPVTADNTQPQRRAGLLRRVAAICYDLLLVLAILMTLAFAVIMLRAGNAIGSGSVWFQLLLLATWCMYFCWSWTHGGQTIGMRAWRLRLQTRAGTAAGWGAALLRFVCAGLSALAFGIGFLWCLVDRDRLTWHDRLSRTELVYRPKTNAGARSRAQ